MNLFGRDELAWDEMAAAGEAFLVERVRLARLTSYTELNVTLVRRTGLPGFDFSRQDEPAAMGHRTRATAKRGSLRQRPEHVPDAGRVASFFSQSVPRPGHLDRDDKVTRPG